MLVVREDQVETFRRARRATFASELLELVRDEHPDFAGRHPEDELRAFVEAGIDEAAAYGITAESDVEQFVEFLVRHGLDFQERSEMEWALDILTDEALSGSQKVEGLDHHETFASEGEARG